MEFKRKNIYISLMVGIYSISIMFFGLNFNFLQNYLLSNITNVSIVNFILIGTVLVSTLVFTLILKLIIENNKTFTLKQVIGKYLSDDIVKKLINKNTTTVELGGKKTDMTVLFADIRNFTSLSEKMSASSVSEILNEYFDAIVPIIEEHQGTINKFIGDALLAIFKDEDNENAAYNAVKCATRIISRLKCLQEKWDEENKPKINIGIGISSGEVFIGNVGSKNRLEYTVIGDTVNTASRIENYNKVYKTNLLISESTYDKVKSKVDVITINNVAIKGKTNKIKLYEVIKVAR